MENEVQVADVLGDVEERSDGVADAARQKEPERGRGQHLIEVDDVEDDRPAEDHVDERGEPFGLLLAQEALGDDAHDGDGPHGDAERDAPAVGERDERERRVAAGDEQVDAAVVEHAEHALGFLGRDRVVERREEVLDQKADAHEQRRGEPHAAAVADGAHDEQHERGDGEQRPHAVAHRVRDLLADRVPALRLCVLHRNTVLG